MGNCIQSPAQVVEGVDKDAIGRTFHDEENSIGSAESFMYMKNTCALEYWDPIRILGSGSISTVHLVRRRPQRVAIPYKEKEDVMTRVKNVIVKPTESEQRYCEGELYALKSINQGHIGDNQLLREMRSEAFTMSNLSHPNIVRIIEGYERKRHVYLIMEQCKGGDLYQVEGTTEQHAKAIVRRILSAVAYMHSKGIVHRDLKMENVMFATPAHKASEVKVIDFGLATKYLSNNYDVMTDKVGTVYTMAPQVMQGVYDNKCDLWSLGVVTYILLSASKPFWGPMIDIPWTERRAIMIDRIMRADYVDMEGGNWENVSDDAKEFVKSLLQLDPARRPSAEEALNSQWMQTRNDMDLESPSQMSPDQRQQRAKRLAVLLVMEKISSADILKLQRVLQRYDPEETGSIAFADLRKALSETDKLDTAEVDRILSGLNEVSIYTFWSRQCAVDPVSNFIHITQNETKCGIDHVDFITKALEKRGRVETDRIFATLDGLDTGNTGKISVQKLRHHVCGQSPSGGEDSGSGDTIPSEWTHELCNLGDDDGEVEIKEVLSWFGRKSIRRIESLRKMKDPTSPKSLKEELATPNNALIPGGCFDPNAKQKQIFIYDNASTSMRRLLEHTQ